MRLLISLTCESLLSGHLFHLPSLPIIRKLKLCSLHFRNCRQAYEDTQVVEMHKVYKNQSGYFYFCTLDHFKYIKKCLNLYISYFICSAHL